MGKKRGFNPDRICWGAYVEAQWSQHGRKSSSDLFTGDLIGREGLAVFILVSGLCCCAYDTLVCIQLQQFHRSPLKTQL